jgi:hypothetical protein
MRTTCVFGTDWLTLKPPRGSIVLRGSDYGSFAIGVDRSYRPFRGFLSRKTTRRDLYQAIVIAKLP